MISATTAWLHSNQHARQQSARRTNKTQLYLCDAANSRASRLIAFCKGSPRAYMRVETPTASSAILEGPADGPNSSRSPATCKSMTYLRQLSAADEHTRCLSRRLHCTYYRLSTLRGPGCTRKKGTRVHAVHVSIASAQSRVLVA
jgi:hypothetical protein